MLFFLSISSYLLKYFYNPSNNSGWFVAISQDNILIILLVITRKCSLLIISDGLRRKLWPEVTQQVLVPAWQQWAGASEACRTAESSSLERTHVQWTRMVWSSRWRSQTSGNDSGCHCTEWQFSLWFTLLEEPFQLTSKKTPIRIGSSQTGTMPEMEKGRPPENKRSRKPAHPVKREINQEMKVRLCLFLTLRSGFSFIFGSSDHFYALRQSRRRTNLCWD